MPANGFTFDEINHIYRVGDRTIPGCTRVLDHSGLVDYDAIRSDILERKSRLGKIVHACTHYYDDGQLDWDSVDERAKPRLHAWIDFRNMTGFKPILREYRCLAEIGNLQYGMQIDAAGIMFKRDAIVEIKTCEQMQWWHAVQGAGYKAGLPHVKYTEPLARFMARDFYVVLLRANGKFKLEGPFNILVSGDRNDREHFDTFAAGLRVTHARMKHNQQLAEITDDSEENAALVSEGEMP